MKQPMHYILNHDVDQWSESISIYFSINWNNSALSFDSINFSLVHLHYHWIIRYDAISINISGISRDLFVPINPPVPRYRPGSR